MAVDPGPSFLRGAGALAATLLSLGIWYRRFDWTTGEDERHTARTPDGWNLALYRYRPKGEAQPLPVVCGHGMEMSGQALYASAIRGTSDRIRGGVTCGAPVLTPASARVPGVTAAPTLRRRGRLLFRAGARLAGPILAYGGSGQLESSFRPCNSIPLAVARYFRNGIPNEATDLVDQFAGWIREGVMRSRDGTIVDSERLAEVKLPLLVMAAAHDLQRPCESVRAAFDAFGSVDKTFLLAGVEAGFSLDFGHDDLLAGRAAPAEVFPRIADWLAARGRP
jgi:hypothetical protein